VRGPVLSARPVRSPNRHLAARNCTLYSLLTVLRARHVRCSMLLSVLLVGVLLFQFAAYDPCHDDHHGRHCCAACHAGHITATADTRVAVLAPPNTSGRYRCFDLIQSAADLRVVVASSRAPPA